MRRLVRGRCECRVVDAVVVVVTLAAVRRFVPLVFTDLAIGAPAIASIAATIASITVVAMAATIASITVAVIAATASALALAALGVAP